VIPTEEEDGSAHSWSGKFCKREISLPLLGIKPEFFSFF
jgi:hypothetical protein